VCGFGSLAGVFADTLKVLQPIMARCLAFGGVKVIVFIAEINRVKIQGK
jgi:hypothetical protein